MKQRVYKIRTVNYRQGGSIIIYSLLIMLSVTTISVALIRLISPKFQIIREAAYSIVALYAADSGMEWCLFSNRIDPASPQPIPNKLQQLNTISGVTIGYYNFIGGSTTQCTYGTPLDFRTVGIYQGISRSLGVSQ